MKRIAVPHFDGLTVEEFLHFAENYPDVARHLPPEREIAKLPRKWIVDLIYTIVGQPFANWVSTRIGERNEKIKTDKKMMINMDPEVAAAYKASQNVSGE